MTLSLFSHPAVYSTLSCFSARRAISPATPLLAPAGTDDVTMLLRNGGAKRGTTRVRGIVEKYQRAPSRLFALRRSLCRELAANKLIFCQTGLSVARPV